MKRVNYATIKKFLVITGIAIVSLLTSLKGQTTLPSFSGYSAPNPSPGAPGESFTPPMAGSPAVNAPGSAEWTRTAGADESMVITGINFTSFSGADEGKDSRFKVYGAGGFHKDASIQRLEKNKAVITLDQSIPSWGMYLIWPGNNAGYGKPIAVNRTDAWWLGPKKATRGSTISVFGRNLSQYNDSTKSYVFLKSSSGAGQWLTVTKVNPYKVDVIVPSTLVNGDYEIWTHNGHGGEYGWSGPLKLTIKDEDRWTSTVFNVKNFGALGNGVKDDTESINKALAAAKSSLGSTVYFPEGTYMISGMLRPSNNTKWVGGDKNKTIIKCNSAFTSTDAMIYGSVNTFQVSHITFDTNNNYKGVHSEAFFLRGSSNVKINNVIFYFPNYNVVQFDNTTDIFLSNCEMIGKLSFFGKSSQLFIDRCNFRLTNDTENALNSWAGRDISMTNSTCQDFNNSDPTNGAGWGKGRFFASTGNFGSGGYTYFSNNRTYDLTVRQSADVDQNSGEQFLWEGYAAGYSGAVLSSSGAVTTLSGFSLTLDKPKIAVITKGRGMGQSRWLVGASGSTITLESAWNVQPDATSTIAVGHFADKIVMYKNYIDGKAYAVTSPDPTATTGIQPYGGVLNFIADANTISEVRSGIANWSTQHSYGIDPNYFGLYINNTITDCRWGIQNGLDMDRPAEVGLLGTTYRRNTVRNTLQSGIVNSINSFTEPVLENFIYEHNTFSNVRSGYSTGGDLGLPRHFFENSAAITNQTFYKNDFSSGSNLSAIRVTQKIALRDNNFSGFAAVYSGLLADPIFKSPLHVIELSGSAGSSLSTAPFSIWNSGINTVSWKAASNSPWLSLSDTVGVIGNERASSNITLKANASTLSPGNYTGTISVIAGTVVKKYTILFKVTSGSHPVVSLTSPSASTSLTAPATVTL
ncbi:MAG: glycosyl hydrolase family 28-related protein, partial [Sphingobacteriaceae bacterium]